MVDLPTARAHASALLSTSPIAINIASCNTLLAKWTPKSLACGWAPKYTLIGPKPPRLEEYPSYDPGSRRKRDSHSPLSTSTHPVVAAFSLAWSGRASPPLLSSLLSPPAISLSFRASSQQRLESHDPTREMVEEKGRAEQGEEEREKKKTTFPSATHLARLPGLFLLQQLVLCVCVFCFLKKRREGKGTLEKRSRSWEAKRGPAALEGGSAGKRERERAEKNRKSSQRALFTTAAAATYSNSSSLSRSRLS